MKYAKYRFTRQLGHYDCGPTAIVNLMKLNGQRIPYKTSHEKLFKALKIKENKGVYPSLFHTFVTKRRIPKSKFKRYGKNLPVKDIEKDIDNGHVIVLAYGRGPSTPGHICLIVGRNNCGLEIVNWDRKKTIQTIGFDRFRKEVLSYNEASYYFFERK